MATEDSLLLDLGGLPGPPITASWLARRGWHESSTGGMWRYPAAGSRVGFEVERVGRDWHLWGVRWGRLGPTRSVYVRAIDGRDDLRRLVRVLGGPGPPTPRRVE